jgi:signal transduction histidine kinase
MTALACLGWMLALAAATAAALATVRLRARAELVTRACHELRSPLTAARLALHLADRDGAVGPLAAVERELGRAALALEDLSAAREGRRAPDHAELVDIGVLLADAHARWAAAARARGTRLVLEPAPHALVRVDRERLAQALGNLVGNALEHGAGPVRLRARLAPGRARLEVHDAGTGLPATVGELAARARAGHGRRGRGLAIAGGIAERHGGRLAAAPSGRGARLVLELPTASAQDPRGAADRGMA